MGRLASVFGLKFLKNHKGFVSFNIVVVMVEKHVLLDNLFYKLAYKAYFGLFSTYLGFILPRHFGENMRNHILIFYFDSRTFVDYFEACGVNQTRYVAY